ncbi:MULTISPECIES: YfhO family protein [unclassified Ruminococcus]|uniref:YfhO family protein n=1 Tax=unclassified Ruminococcus TaxID=2608920 RepID=UPI0021091D5F|nr:MULTISPECIES: YfhO family protein [unclassified Ruminococcus]MCQ4021567.1 YfhO family protein [Ruminococcus sp. zg-924]MCQ4114012.1 YfhO family protein [Ruminococcus sp. zg-921]
MSKTKTKKAGAANYNRLSKLADEPVMSDKKLYLILCFAVPFLLMGFAFAFNGVFPFGEKQILVTDFWQQYFPFYTEVQDKLQTFQSMLYSWDTGMGSNFWALAAYYFASPMNLLLAIVPYELLREALTFFLLCRIGLAGLFCGVFLKGVFKRNDISLVFFGTMYALCAFTLGYYWNVMWFDTFALFPLVAYGTYSLVKYGRVRVYIIALAASLLFNYYIGFFTCIFTVIFFICLCILFKMPIKLILRRFGKIAVSSVIGVGISAIMLLPELLALSLSYSANNVWPSITKFRYEIPDLIGNFASMVTPNVKEGLPNINCSFVCVILAGVFLLSKKISLREKIVASCVMAFMLFSIDNRLFDFMWHGFHSTNMIPHRFSFIVSFVLVVAAYRAFTLLKDITPVEIIGMLTVASIVIICASIGQQSDTAVYTSVALTVLYVGIFFLLERKLITIKVAYILLGIVLLGEMISSVLLSVETVRVTQRTGYPDKRTEIRACVEDIKSKDKEAFYRMELTKFYTLNDPPLYQYPGVAQFSSTANVNVTNYVEGIGGIGWDAGNRYYYAESTPVTNAFLGIKYLIAKFEPLADTNNWKFFGKQKNMSYYRNNTYLSLGFMADSKLEYFKADKTNPFKSQQDLFVKSTGIKDDLYERIKVSSASHENLDVYYRGVDSNNSGIYGQYSYKPKDVNKDSKLSWNYTIPEDCSVYVYAKIDNSESISIFGGSKTTSQSYNIKRPYLLSAGTYKKGDNMNITSTVEKGKSGSADIYVCIFNQSVYNKGYKILKDELLNVTSIDSTNIKGDITVKQDGLMYTSIPYESGWSAYVDGEKAEITPIDNAMTGLKLSKGKHTVEFKYTPAGFNLGLTISISCTLLFALFCFVQWYLKKKGKTFGPIGKLPEVAGEFPDTDDSKSESVSLERSAKKK